MAEVTRRNFLKGAAAAGAAAASAAALAGCSSSSSSDTADETTSSASSIYSGDYTIDFDNVAPIDPVDVPDEWTEEADVVVVGSGAGGLFAAAYLAASGKTVVVCEASSKCNGTSQEATYCLTRGGIPSLYGTWGSLSDPYDDQVVFDYYFERADYSINPNLLMNMVVAGHESIEWLIQQGLDIVDIMEDAGYPGVNSGSVILRGSLYDEGDITTWGYIPSITSQKPMMDAIHELGESYGATYRLSTPVTGLVYDGERVVGVRAESADDGEIFIKANDAVTIHAGDFAYNRDLQMMYCPTLGYGAANSVEDSNNDGSLTRMALGLGADMTDFDSFSVRDGTCTLGDKQISFHSMWYADDILSRQPWLTIDQAGNRVSYYQYGEEGSVADATAISQAELALCSTALGVPGRRIIPIWDDKWHDIVPINGSLSMGGNGGRLYRDEENSPFPWQDDETRTPTATVDHDFEEGIANSIEAGYIQQADTIAELAELIGVDADVLQGHVDDWNAKCEAGEGDEEYNYYASQMYALDTPPYYFSKTGASIQAIGTGVRIDEHGRVMRVDASVIPGLYAGFNFAGGLTGNGQGCEEPLYSCVGTSLHSGYLCATSILELEG